MSEREVPSPFAATMTVAQLTWTRLIRGRALWVSVVIGLLPVAYAMLRTRVGEAAPPSDIFVFETLVLMLLAPMFVASSIGEDIEDRTSTYLWSRPVPRWAVVAGKLCALVPVTFAIVLASFLLAVQVSNRGSATVDIIAALAAGTFAICVVAAAIATLAPKHGMALTIGYLLIDLPLGALGATLQQLSVTYQIRAISGLGNVVGAGDPVAGAIGLVVLVVVWGTIAALRLRRLEA